MYYGLKIMHKMWLSIYNISLAKADEILSRAATTLYSNEVIPWDVITALQKGWTEIPLGDGTSVPTDELTAMLCLLVPGVRYEVDTVAGDPIITPLSVPGDPLDINTKTGLQSMANFQKQIPAGISFRGIYNNGNTKEEKVFLWHWDEIVEGEVPAWWCSYRDQTEEDFWDVVKETMGYYVDAEIVDTDDEEEDPWDEEDYA